MKGYVETYRIAFLIVGIGTAIYSEQGIATSHFRVLSIIFSDGKQVECLHIKPDTVEMEIPQSRVIKSITQCQGPATQKTAALHRVGVEGGRVTEVGVLLQHGYAGSRIGQ